MLLPFIKFFIQGSAVAIAKGSVKVRRLISLVMVEVHVGRDHVVDQVVCKPDKTVKVPPGCDDTLLSVHIFDQPMREETVGNS